jgi:hypothetical protein
VIFVFLMIGRAITDTGFAVKDAAAEGKSGFAGRLASNMKDAVVTAGSEGVAAFKQGAQPRLDNFKAAVAARSGLQGSPAESAPAAPAPASH